MRDGNGAGSAIICWFENFVLVSKRENGRHINGKSSILKQIKNGTCKSKYDVAKISSGDVKFSNFDKFLKISANPT